MRALCATLIAGLLSAAGVADAAQAPPAATTALAELSWLVGHWQGETARGRHIEEMWMPAEDGVMIGSFRWARGNGRWLFEFMSIDVMPPPLSSAPPLTLRIKHFDRGFRGLEDQASSTTLMLVEQTADRVVFELRETGRTVRVGYARSGADQLTATFDETEAGKPAVHLEFPYTRVGRTR
jgi:hypothetical protein